MVKEKIKNVIIFGGTSNIALDFVKMYKNKFTITLFSRSTKKILNCKNIKLNFNLNKLNIKKIKKYLINADVIIGLAGVFQKRFSVNMYNINLIFYEKLFSIISELNRKKKIIIVSSLDSLIPNPNSPGYSATKAGLSHLMSAYQVKTKKKLSFTNIVCGAINTKMRKHKRDSNIIMPADISKLINFIIEFNENIIIDKIIFYPRNKTYTRY